MKPAQKCCKSCVIKADCLNKAHCHERTQMDPSEKNFKSHSFAFFSSPKLRSKEAICFYFRLHILCNFICFFFFCTFTDQLDCKVFSHH